MKHASLFSGIGGPEIAASMLGWENAFHCEINPFGRAVLDYWYPESKSYEDITKTDFKPWRGKIDVLTGGFPCQPFSYAGKRGGREDDRYLWPEMLRAIDEIRPTWVIGENVAGITTMVEGGVLTDLGGGSTLFDADNEFHGYELEQSFTIERICRDLERLRYSVQPMLIPAAAVGAPHRRDRVFILAFDADTDRRNDLREAGADAGTGNEERLQERDEIRVAGKPDQLRPAIQGTATDPQGEQGNGNGLEQSEHCQAEQKQSGGRGGEDGYLQPAIRWDSADTDLQRCDKSILAEKSGGAERFNSETHFDGRDGYLRPERRWATFPTRSPVHAGNDGIPFGMDGASIPFTKWRTEALKAYGNAIVPQVMYRIFQAIEQAGSGAQAQL